MTFRELNRAIFRREPVHEVLWQPRLEHWYNVNKQDGTLPERYRDLSLLEVFDDLDCSVRPYWAFNPTIRIDEDESVRSETREEGLRTFVTTRTPVGDLVMVHLRTSTTHVVAKFPVVTPDDMRIMAWILEHRRVWFDQACYDAACDLIGERAAPQIYIPRINLMRLIIDFMGFENGMTALFEYPAEIERFFDVINETDNAILDVVAASPIEIVNYGDNVHQALCSPPLFERWVMPEYIRRNARLHAAGKKTYPHWDGDCGTLLPYARDCGFDGYEAITPVPQGDVTLEQVRDALGDRILLDGVPCTDFLPSEPVESLVTNTRKCIEYFAPNLVLGISDEISPVGDIERVRMVSEIVAEHNAAARAGASATR
ncbi:MAG TPA: uroporphyrinogen decarboxylase family protein [Candidatus Hydrogenedentes bacterium]|nr:uroporphyrinogen decarboxylase family protein [Candidatus Hydrogenedentota bacterium]HOZ49309.1 uroporphyrinogen decarboxylase family protein [Candidatus Hydrogenedentota bacterium]HPG69662.1 uroporphyrinogen decarboxylase family protein [Candidatus Hydrogenedentota bacterium]